MLDDISHGADLDSGFSEDLDPGILADHGLLSSFPGDGAALVIGANGGIGRAVTDALRESNAFETVIAVGRSGSDPDDLPLVDVTNESSLLRLAMTVAADLPPLRLVFDASGMLHDETGQPEKSLRQIDPKHMAQSFAVNASGPALLMKHLFPLMARRGRSAFVTLSAKVGSIGDNQLGGWYSYRASKAALNQLVHSAAIELKRSHPDAVCAALHPGTVETRLSEPFAKRGLTVRAPSQAAALLLDCLNGLGPLESGGFFDYSGEPLPW